MQTSDVESTHQFQFYLFHRLIFFGMRRSPRVRRHTFKMNIYPENAFSLEEQVSDAGSLGNALKA